MKSLSFVIMSVMCIIACNSGSNSDTNADESNGYFTDNDYCEASYIVSKLRYLGQCSSDSENGIEVCVTAANSYGDYATNCGCAIQFDFLSSCVTNNLCSGSSSSDCSQQLGDLETCFQNSKIGCSY
jgi:hypothetical protein